jgi:hypothetical protein
VAERRNRVSSTIAANRGKNVARLASHGLGTFEQSEIAGGHGAQ